VGPRDLARGSGSETASERLVNPHFGRGNTIALRIAGDPTRGDEPLAALQARIAADPDAAEPRFAYAVALEDLGRMTAAHRAYVEVLDRDPLHLGALTNLGSILHGLGARDVARAFYTKAVVEHPGDAIARINLGNALVEDGELEAARFHYEAALTLVPGHPNAHFALAALHRRLGDEAAARRHDERAFERPWIQTIPYRGSGSPLRLLLLLSANGGNVVTTQLLDDRTMVVTVLFVESYRPGLTLPAHDLIFNAIGDVERSPGALEIAQAIVARASVPVLNLPANVVASSRSHVAERVRGLPHVVAPHTELIARAEITAGELARRGFTFPLLLRSPGFHTGQHFELIADAAALPAAVAVLPGPSLLAIEYLDVRDAAGEYRKYRVISIGRELFPLHLAIAQQWKVHYFSADMRERPDHQAEEAAFLANGPARLGASVAAALEGIRARLDLEYGGIDFGIDAAGKVALFEANATMAIALPDDDPAAAGRRAAADRIIAAFRAYALARASGPPLRT
jgi:Flp pilus assembly protein TadD